MKANPVSTLRAWQCSNDHIGARGQKTNEVTTHGAQPTTHGIAHNSVADCLGHNETETAGLAGPPVNHVKNRRGSTHTTAPTHSGAKVNRTSNPVSPGEHRTAAALRLRGEFGATLATTRGQNGTAGTGTHTKTEAVLFCTTTIVRLESSLAHSGISKAQL